MLLIFNLNGDCGQLIQDQLFSHVQAETACGHCENCFVVIVYI